MSEGLDVTGGADRFYRSHRLLMMLLWAHVPGLAVTGLALGESLDVIVFASLALTALALTGMSVRRWRLGAMTVSLGLLAASGVIIHYTGGASLSHFHVLTMIAAISFYLDPVTLGVGVLAAAGYHLSLDATASETASHVAAIAALAVLMTVGWRLNSGRATHDPSGDRFRIGFEEAPIGMAVLKPSGDFLEANRAMSGILGYDHTDLIGSNIASLIHVDDKEELGEAWEEMGSGGGQSATKWMRCTTSDGHTVWAKISLSLVPRTDMRNALVVLQLEDVTHPYQEQRRLETLMKGKDEFVAAVGDEIREPLGHLIDLTDAAEHSRVDNDDTLPRIEAHAREIASIVEDLVMSARSGTGPVSVSAHGLDVGQICHEVIASTPGTQEVAVDLRATEAWADPALTRHIIGNMIGNAVKFGGSSIALRTVESGPDTVVQVFDNGPELPEAERDRMFTGDLHHGPPVTRPATVGLSMAVSRHLARQMDGDLVYRRTTEGENVFELRLPSERISEIPRRRGVLGGSVSV